MLVSSLDCTHPSRSGCRSSQRGACPAQQTALACEQGRRRHAAADGLFGEVLVVDFLVLSVAAQFCQLCVDSSHQVFASGLLHGEAVHFIRFVRGGDGEGAAVRVVQVDRQVLEDGVDVPRLQCREQLGVGLVGDDFGVAGVLPEIGRASCRERVYLCV